MFSSSKTKTKDSHGKKSQFYVEFLGWMECRGLRGQAYTEPIIHEMRRRLKKTDALPKLTIQLSQKDIKIIQELEEKKHKGIKKITFPTIPARDVTFVHQATRPGTGTLDDIVACIYLGYIPRTQRYVHVHVYRFDEVRTAALFTSQMSQIVESNLQHTQEVEINLASKGEIDDPNPLPPADMNTFQSTYSTVSSTTSTYSDDESPVTGSDEIEPDLQSLADVQAFDSVTSELKHRLQIRDTPLLLPPKDYDTISRAHGNLEQINKRRCMNQTIIGVNAFRNEADEDQEDATDEKTSETDNGKLTEKTTVEKQSPAKAGAPENRSPLIASPKLQHMFLASNAAKSPQISHRPTNLYEPKLSPNVAPKFGFPEIASPGNELPSPKVSPKLQSPVSDLVYPPKDMNSPNSPRVFPKNAKSDLSRQNSQNSLSSDGSKRSHRSDEIRPAASVQHYVYGPNDDVYAVPIKASKPVPVLDELPPDYLDDDDFPQTGSNQPYFQPFLNRSLPAEIMRDKLPAGNRSRPNSGELRLGRRTDSPIILKHPHTPVHSPGNNRKAPNNR